MKRLIRLSFLTALSIGFIACGNQNKQEEITTDQRIESTSLEKPSDADINNAKRRGV